MEMRLVIAYALIALMAAVATGLAWHWLTRHARLRRKRERLMRDRWLKPPAAVDRL
jgi:hypothetical protein